ncbi:NACHT domain-containing protein [Flavobacteriaceae bacterium F89]|uniref:NACHT domain-containing protein n=1 Tax=Cerina litoralis TaxID=2874477 RepID=A0AAE3EXF4_9FLAO|nr:NACHT domain-containing protein [Cerina litoralis]MCG2461467.1 NACHT domain-containing protein [Cerina litoralis]
MGNEKIEKLDELFKSYNYSVSSKSNSDVRIYTLRYGMYHAAEILLINENFDPKEIKSEYSELGYATEIRPLKDIENIEEYLFEGFFIKTPLGNELKTRYKQFVSKQIKNLPEGSKYEYVKSSYDILQQDETGALIETQTYDGSTGLPLIEKLNSLMSESKGALFIILEAAAGFGKTCTAYEVLNTFSTKHTKQLPFFTELSRNREARIFNHILHKEIDEQFPNGIKRNIVIEQITKGRIPLIIDGFDELITKESNKEEVESMLTTIVELLKGKAKIIITSRKTAIFNSDEFLNSINQSKNDFSLARIEIKEPTIENWLSKERISLLEQNNFPLDQVANPVLLSYLKNISEEKLQSYLNDSQDSSLIDKYVDYLLKREQIRQNIKLNTETQLRIFRKLMRFMTEFNITAESKDTIKDLIKSYNQKILQSSLKEYISEEKPSMEDLVETLSNHVFLDRKPNGDIGFVNDFIFGLLVGDNLILNKYEEYYPEIDKILPQDFASKAVQSFKIQSVDRRKMLLEEFNSKPFNFEPKFFFNLEYSYLNKFRREYNNLYIDDNELNNILFETNQQFTECVFSNITFNNCVFNLIAFCGSTFHNCSFYNCQLEPCNNKKFNDFAVFACTSNNDFLETLDSLLDQNQEDSKVENIAHKDLNEIFVLSQFFGIGNLKPRARKFSHLKDILIEYQPKEINKILSSLKSKGYLHFKDDVGFIAKSGINYFNQNKSQL